MVSGLTLAGASAISHDLYASVFARGRATEKKEVAISRMAVVGFVWGAGTMFVVLRHWDDRERAEDRVFAVAQRINSLAFQTVPEGRVWQ